jgi:hypothetical protein
MALETKDFVLDNDKNNVNRFGVNNPDVDLTKAVTLNQNPLLIPEGTNVSGWVYFQNYLAKLYKDNPNKAKELNSKEGFLLSQQIIRDFNTNYIINIDDTFDIWVPSNKQNKYTSYESNQFNVERKTITRKNVASFRFLDKFPNGLIDVATVKAAQNYHLLTSFSGDNRVLVDGWVGSQTAQLKYPGREAIYLRESETVDVNNRPLGILTKDGIVSNRPQYKTGLIPVVWGNQRYVIDARVVDQYIEGVESGRIPRFISEQLSESGITHIPLEYYIPYDSTLHDATLQFKDQVKFEGAPKPNKWDIIGQEPVVYKDPAKTNAFIKAQQLKDKKLRYISDIKQTITSSKEDLAKQKELKKQAFQDALKRSKELAKLYAK